MKRAVIALTAGALFGLGLGISGVANPVVINNFLDLAGDHFDLTLIILFASAVIASTVIYQLTLRWRKRPVWDQRFFLPTNTAIDGKLIVGSLLFGVGWGLSGYCVGPAFASLAGAYTVALPYLGATVVGVLLHDLVFRPSTDSAG